MAAGRVEVGRWDERAARAARAGSGTAQSLEALAWLLDSSIPIPGTRIRIGLDALLGLIPGLGDIAGTLISSFILLQAARLGIPRVTLMRMGFNVLVDSVLGIVPLAGDIFDIAWKANLRNVDLLRAHLDDPGRARKADWAFATLFILAVVAVAGLLGWGAYALARLLF